MPADDTSIPSDAAPTWWDIDKPHYEPFHPSLMTGVSTRATEVALTLSCCQICRVRYLTTVPGFTDEFERAATIVESRWLPGWDTPSRLRHIGDCDGSHMSTPTLRVVQYWRRSGSEWHRMPEFEVELSG